ncbi:TetR/AcrR family transcriptional regulator [Roseivirga pacifica]|uniref:TetR/AcrR family transcriptional regulator n=1 Tax=Roseivirga pacifica TaxID=1267423 RepID=UPI00227A1E55|nr:TetR/AcrR family transcriptional regulator [Roseivirga pacifica]
MVDLKQDKRTVILESTLLLLREHGFHGTPISLIAQHAGVGAGTIYRYFENKEKLINELFTEIKKRVIKAMLKDYREEGTYKERFKHLWTNLVEYCINHPIEFHFVEQYRYAPFMKNGTREETFIILAPIMQFFIESKRAKAMKDFPLYTLIALLYGPIVSLAKLHIDSNQTLTKERIEQAAEACWDAVSLKEE